MPARQRLQNRRPSINLWFEHESLRYFVTYSCFDGGGIAEIFLNCGKLGSAADVIAADGATAISIALQYGASADVLLHAMKRSETNGPLGALGKALALCIEDAQRR